MLKGHAYARVHWLCVHGKELSAHVLAHVQRTTVHACIPEYAQFPVNQAILHAPCESVTSECLVQHTCGTLCDGARTKQCNRMGGARVSEATSVQTVAWPEGDGSWSTATLAADGPTRTCHSMARDLHAEVSSASAKIYARSIGLGQGMWLSYVNEELSITFLTPIAIGVDNATAHAVAYTNGTLKRSKIRHIDARQDWVPPMRDSSTCKLWKVHTLENESDLLTKIHKPDQFERLRSRCMVLQNIPTEQRNGAAAGNDPKPGADG